MSKPRHAFSKRPLQKCRGEHDEARLHDTTLFFIPPLQATKTLLVTDMVVKVEDEVPEIVCEDPRPLLFHARDNALERVEDTPEVRVKGWRRIVQVRG